MQECLVVVVVAVECLIDLIGGHDDGEWQITTCQPFGEEE
jgi:hypothetical protein